MTENEIRAGLTIIRDEGVKSLCECTTSYPDHVGDPDCPVTKLFNAMLEQFAGEPDRPSGVITAAPRLTNEEDTKALWLTRRNMPREPER